MKTTIAILLSALLLGCASTNEKAKRCETYSDVYALYLASLEIRQPSQEEVDAAAAAAVFLRLYCGWTGPRGVAVRDGNGVDIIYPPR